LRDALAGLAGAGVPGDVLPDHLALPPLHLWFPRVHLVTDADVEPAPGVTIARGTASADAAGAARSPGGRAVLAGTDRAGRAGRAGTAPPEWLLEKAGLEPLVHCACPGPKAAPKGAGRERAGSPSRGTARPGAAASPAAPTRRNGDGPREPLVLEVSTGRYLQDQRGEARGRGAAGRAESRHDDVEAGGGREVWRESRGGAGPRRGERGAEASWKRARGPARWCCGGGGAAPRASAWGDRGRVSTGVRPR